MQHTVLEAPYFFIKNHSGKGGAEQSSISILHESAKVIKTSVLTVNKAYCVAKGGGVTPSPKFSWHTWRTFMGTPVCQGTVAAI